MKNFLHIFIFLLGHLQAQVINAYAKVTSITSSSVLALSNVDQTGHTFTVGGQVIVMQMQDNVIGSNTTNVSTFGNLSTIANAGRYEIRIISAITPTSGTPTSVTITPALANTYNFSANTSVQLISFRDLGSNYTTTANITGAAWNGSIGGVVAFRVTNTLTLQHRILADGIGFRGGSFSNNNSGPVCTANSNTLYLANNANLGWKGEGIYRSTNTTFNNARGRLLNGGGGGNDHNAGGGGGGNFTQGGQGGDGFNNCGSNPGGGLGGASFSTSISSSRIFMGGGGGGGQQNDAQNSSGGNGGGIILISANTIRTGTTCGSSIQISANGVDAITGGNDGMGGGGAAGSIVIQATTFSINASCSVTIRANGGSGGNVNNTSRHGGGGGGAQGVIIFSSAQPTLNVTVQTNNGTPGSDNSGGGSLSATAGTGSNSAGIVASSSGPLPVTMVKFGGEIIENHVRIQWQTATEKNNNQFILEKSNNGVDFDVFAKVKGAGNSSTLNQYEVLDKYPVLGNNYYRLSQIDDDGTVAKLPTIVVNYLVSHNFETLKIYPNPLQNKQTLVIETAEMNYITEINIYDLAGRRLYFQCCEYPNKQAILIDNLNLEKGIYQLIIKHGDYGITSKKLILE